MTDAEFAILGVPPGGELPSSGEHLSVKVDKGHGSAAIWTTQFGPVILERFGIELHPGSLNLWAENPVEWRDPVSLSADGMRAEFCPVVLEEVAVGMAFRGNRERPCYLEVFSPVGLRDRLGGLTDGQWISVRLLSGRDFASSA